MVQSASASEQKGAGRPGPSAGRFLRTLRTMLEMIKFEHTVFALPFAFLGGLLAVRGFPPRPWPAWAWPRPATWGLILVAMVTARSAAMAFNRLVDREIDRRNPRTAGRALPSGLLRQTAVAGFTLICSSLFVLSAWLLNPLSFWLSFPALAVVLLYSYLKRFTWLSHFVLGYALSIAPEGSWIAVTGQFSVPVIIVCVVVTTWVAGFDVIYACQDASFDAREGLYSIPGRLGVPRALRISFLLHGLTILAMAGLWYLFALSWVALAGLGLLSVLLVWEHLLVRPDDLSRLNVAFFTLNGTFSVALFLVVLLDVVFFPGGLHVR